MPVAYFFTQTSRPPTLPIPHRMPSNDVAQQDRSLMSGEEKRSVSSIIKQIYIYIKSFCFLRTTPPTIYIHLKAALNVAGYSEHMVKWNIGHNVLYNCYNRKCNYIKGNWPVLSAVNKDIQFLYLFSVFIILKAKHVILCSFHYFWNKQHFRVTVLIPRTWKYPNQIEIFKKCQM